MKARKKAAKAIYKRIAAVAPTADAEQLAKLAEAHAKVKYGTQGRTDYNYNQRVYREKPLEKGTGFGN